MHARSPYVIWQRVVLTLLLFVPTFLSLAANLQLVSALDSSNDSPASANGDSYFPIISPDGRYVLFASTANNLVPTNSGGPVPTVLLHTLNVFLRDRLSGTNILVSANLAGNGANWNSLPSGISTNGQYALFESEASDLVSGDMNNANDIFVRDLDALFFL